MTARRPSRITGQLSTSGSQDEEHYRELLQAVSDVRWDVEPGDDLRDSLNAQIRRFARDMPDDPAVRPVHPALTDYGPESASRYFQQARANQEANIQQQSVPIPRASLGSRSQKTSPIKAHGRVGETETAARQTRSRNDADPARTSYNEREPISNRLGSPTGARKLWRQASEESSNRDEDPSFSSRKATKRVRRGRDGEQPESPKNIPRPHTSPTGVTTLRNMRSRRAAMLNQDPDAQHEVRSVDDQVRNQSDTTIATWISEPTPAASIFGPQDQHMQEYVSAARRQWQATEINLQPNSTDWQPLNSLSAEVVPEDTWRMLSDTPSLPPGRRATSNALFKRNSFSQRSHVRRRWTRQDIASPASDRADHGSDDSDDASVSSQDPSIPTCRLSRVNRDLTRPGKPLLSDSRDRWENALRPSLDDFEPHLAPIDQPHPYGQERNSLMNSQQPLTRCRITSNTEQNITPDALDDLSNDEDDAIPSRRAVQGNRRHVTADETSHFRVNNDVSEHKISVSMASRRPSGDPPVCKPKGDSCGWPEIPTEMYFEISKYLSRDDALNLRQVCRRFSIEMIGPVFGSVVVPFGRAMYDVNKGDWEHNPPPGSMFEKYGLAIRKFGLSFEADAGMVLSANYPSENNSLISLRLDCEGSHEDHRGRRI
jgi:hypothetical protein